ncbi:MAG TPA: tetratricopeptide repeat protein, partial [Thermoanaerobaculia bacterium]
ASRRAVALSQGEDAAAQAALGASLLASGDRKGAAAAFGRALELSPEDGEIRREMTSLKKKG